MSQQDPSKTNQNSQDTSRLDDDAEREVNGQGMSSSVLENEKKDPAKSLSDGDRRIGEIDEDSDDPETQI